MSYRNEQWEEICLAIQKRSLENISLEVKSAKTLRAKISQCLQFANDNKILKNQLHEINALLKLNNSSEIKEHKYWEIMGGEKNFNRDKSVPHFQLNNGCWFDFAITINEMIKPARIIGFDFELRFPEPVNCEEKVLYPRFIRIDLNLPNHANDDRNMRFHLHPGHDDIMIHSPAMTPLEILHLFLYGIHISEKSRNK